MSQHKADIAIVGGGLVGLALASSLRDTDWSVIVIDAGKPAPMTPRPAPGLTGHALSSGFDARVLSVNPASHDFLCRTGGWPDDGDLAGYQNMTVMDSRGSGRIDFDAEDLGEPSLGYLLENRALVAMLHETVSASSVTLLDGESISDIERTDAGYSLSLASGALIDCQLLVGADGGNSIVREQCGLKSLTWPYEHNAVVTTIQTELAHGATARQWFTDEGPLAFLPLPDNDQRLCSIVWSTTDQAVLMGLDDEAFCERLTRASESCLGHVEGSDARYTFPLRQSQAFSYVGPHLALIGDAAHTIHPLAGQGANLGLADAVALSQVLRDARMTDESIADVAVLKRYQRRRQPQNVAMAAAMEAFARLYQTDNPAVSWLRNAGTRLIDSQSLLKSILVRAASGR